MSEDESRRNSFSSKQICHSTAGGREHYVPDTLLLKTYQRGKDTSQTKSVCQRTTEGSILCGKKLAQNQDSTLKHLFEVLVYLHRELRLHTVVL